MFNLEKLQKEVTSFRDQFPSVVVNPLYREWHRLEHVPPTKSRGQNKWMDVKAITELITLFWNEDMVISQLDLWPERFPKWAKSKFSFRNGTLRYQKIRLAKCDRRTSEVLTEIIDNAFKQTALKETYQVLYQRTVALEGAIYRLKEGIEGIRHQIESDETLEGRCPHCPRFWHL